MLFTAARRAFAAAANGGFARPARRGLSVVSSGAPDVAPRRLNSKDVHVVEKFKNGWPPGDSSSCSSSPGRLFSVTSPARSSSWARSRKTNSSRSSAAGRRWGKSVMLDAWVTFVRRRKGESGGATSATPAARAKAAVDPFEGTWAHDKFPHTTCIGVKLDMSGNGSFYSVVRHVVHGFNQATRRRHPRPRPRARRCPLRWP